MRMKGLSGGLIMNPLPRRFHISLIKEQKNFISCYFDPLALNKMRMTRF